MEIIVTRQIITRTAAVWFLIISAIGVVIYLFISIGSPVPRLELLFAVFVTTYFTMTPPVIVGYITGYLLRKRELPAVILRTMPFTITAMSMGSLSSYVIVQMIFSIMPNLSFIDCIITIYVPSLILTVIFTCVTPSIELLRREKVLLKKDIDKISSAVEKLDANFMLLKQQGSLYRIAHEDIIYLSSHGKKTTIHTEKMDYEIPQGIKDLDRALPARLFMRIHKQFIVNVGFISRIRHYEGGRYWAYLNDNDENTLPIGRKYAPALKLKLEE